MARHRCAIAGSAPPRAAAALCAAALLLGCGSVDVWPDLGGAGGTGAAGGASGGGAAGGSGAAGAAGAGGGAWTDCTSPGGFRICGGPKHCTTEWPDCPLCLDEELAQAGGVSLCSNEALAEFGSCYLCPDGNICLGAHAWLVP